MNQFTEVKKDEFEVALNSFSEGWIEGRVGNELTYNLTLPNRMVIVVFSSISYARDTARGLGEDSIKCVLLDQISERPLDKEIRTHRTPGWNRRLVAKLNNLLTTAEERVFSRCKKCFSVMTRRTSETGVFWGCLAYPDCKYTMNQKPIEDKELNDYLNSIIKYKSKFDSDTFDKAINGDGDKGEAFDNLLKSLEWEARCEWVKGKHYKQSFATESSNRLFNLLDDMQKFTPNQEACFFSLCRERSIKARNLKRGLIGHLANEAKTRDAKEQPLREPKAGTLATVRAVPLGMETETDLVPTDTLENLSYDFDNFNPMQSDALRYVSGDNNLTVAAPTASGKTVVAEAAIAEALQVNPETKAIYLAPMKALGEERIADFTSADHTFSKYKISIMTGDYSISEERHRELQDANIIIMTNEMLATRSRMFESEKNDWLRDVSVCVVDETHIISMAGRGDSTESALMMFSKLNPEARLIFLSATMPNCVDLAKWAQLLNGKETALIESDYRPCKVEKHYIKVPWANNYQDKQANRLLEAWELLFQHPKDRWLVFTGTKAWGHELLGKLRDAGLKAGFHNADLTRQERLELENAFRDGDLQYLISTTTNAYGVNLPARRVLIAHTAYGIEDMAVCDINQMIGRSGRPRYDKQGDAYILIDADRFGEWKDRIEAGEDIVSTFGNLDVLQFHALAEVCNENIKVVDDFYEWYSRSLACLQGIIPAEPAEVIDRLRGYGCVKLDGDKIYPTQLGEIAFWFYYAPRMVYRWRQNLLTFKNYFDLHDEVEIPSRALGILDSVRIGDIALGMTYTWLVEPRGYVLKTEQDRLNVFRNVIRKNFAEWGDSIKPDALATLKDARTVIMRANGQEGTGTVRLIENLLKQDFGRMTQALGLIAKMCLHIEIGPTLEVFKLRFEYAVKEQFTSLVAVKGCGKGSATRLYTAGIYRKEDLLEEANWEKIVGALGSAKRAELIVNNAKFDNE